MVSFPDPLRRQLYRQKRELTIIDREKANASTLGGMSTRINAIESDVATRASASSVAALSSTVSSMSSAIGSKADASALAAVAATVPAPADSAPPPVQIDSLKGSATRFAREDHTHESRLQARRMQVTPNAQGRYVYTFPKAYPAGVVPIVSATAETPAAATYRNDVSILEGATTNTQTTIIITRTQQTQTLAGTLTALLGSVLTLFVPVTTAVYINVMSRAPS